MRKISSKPPLGNPVAGVLIGGLREVSAGATNNLELPVKALMERGRGQAALRREEYVKTSADCWRLQSGQKPPSRLLLAGTQVFI
jgi:hypothetical protein